MHRTLWLLLCALLCQMGMAQEKPPRRLCYWPEGSNIVCVNGQNRYTRALYGGHTLFRIETTDRPVFATYNKELSRNLRLFLSCGGQTIQLDSTDFCEARYQGGWRGYMLRHDSWGKGTLSIDVLARTDNEGAVWRFRTQDFTEPVTLTAWLCPVAKLKMERYGDLGVEPRESFEPSPPCGAFPALGPDAATQDTLLSWGGERETFLILTDGLHLSRPDGPTGQRVYDKAEQDRRLVIGQLVCSTPDAFINTMAANLCAAADATYDGQTILHGAIGWRVPLAGWRGAYAADVLGWHDRARSHFTAYANSMVTEVPPVIPHPSQDSAMAMARARKEWGTQMYSNGYISRYPGDNTRMHHYDMNLNFVDALLWHFQYDADVMFMRRMWPLLCQHIEWEKRNFDPDGDHLYDAYCCIWASDALFYNGGAVTHSSAYNYRANLLMARIAELIGEDPSLYKREAWDILTAMKRRLWLEDEGHWAEYQDHMGRKRLHRSAALWSVYIPIDCGACTPKQAFRATQYVDKKIPHIPVSIQGDCHGAETDLHTIATSDWMPYDWSINNVAHEEVMNMALACFEAGNREMGYRLFKADVLDGMFLGQSPGNFGQISYLDKARAEAYRDFADNVGVTARALVQGLFGIRPQALYGHCVVQPGFPADWDSCSVATPYLSYNFHRTLEGDVYEVEQHFPQPLQVMLRISNGDGSFTEVIGSDEPWQRIVVPAVQVVAPAEEPMTPLTQQEVEKRRSCVPPEVADEMSDKFQPCDISKSFNADVDDIFRQQYWSPRPNVTTLQLPLQGVGQWCHPLRTAVIEDDGLRRAAVGDKVDTGLGFSFITPQRGHNVAYASLWDNYPDSVRVDIRRPVRARAAWLLLVGSTNHMQSRIDNAAVVAHYTDGTADTLFLENPVNWCPIEQDYYTDGLAFNTGAVRPYRLHLGSGWVSRNLCDRLGVGSYVGETRTSADTAEPRIIPDGAATVLRMTLTSSKRLRSISLHALSNDIVVGLMAVTLER